ncbi:lysine N(6)-hydroxylase/L-ornithine N(5)-oxygenase family protein [Pseudalkalibacillus berkeleyi]|uniref:L-lysine N6-monooxygenase MbtG n=1 Tax=Pseudalkalibacillus berkeleyi TaxID=1069813 RepID=A0ABS9H296_9BACL|nr:SidA/IucD/PvdA family monooxygenase [Pseudalkalibacillus berkeleyi]MCF6139067.1 SidA/IucD/PvdA family monooxygenase [Pseudalkalibacillus berkeleyi]
MGIEHEHVHDLIGVGIGPFNLSLAALLDQIPEVDAVFFEQREGFDWHPGMLIDGTRMQVPFLADLVTMADPMSPYSFLNYLTEHNRMYRFYFLQRLEIPRNEYNHYCQWAVNKLESCRFNHRVVGLVHDENEEVFRVKVLNLKTEQTETYLAKNLVLGTGSIPSMPKSFQELEGENLFHTSEFITHQERCRKAKSITLVGSGQSAAEVFRELLREQGENGYRLDWITRSKGFSSMEESQLSLEHFSPDYVDYFYQLPQEKKDQVFAGQELLYKGISSHTITDIYDLLYEYSLGGQSLDVGLQVLTEVSSMEKLGDGYRLKCHQWQQEADFTHDSQVVIVGTGYRPNIPEFVHELGDYLQWDDCNRYIVDSDYRLKLGKDVPNQIYVHSGISHSHGVGSTNLGLAVQRNKIIINHLLGKPYYPMSKQSIFQKFSGKE